MTDLEWTRALNDFTKALNVLARGKAKEEKLRIKRELQKKHRERFKRVFVDSYVVPAHTKRMPRRRRMH